MKKPPFQTLLDYSILSLAVSPELYGITTVCTPPPPPSFLLGEGWPPPPPPPPNFLLREALNLLLNFQKAGLDKISVLDGVLLLTFLKGLQFLHKK